MNHTSTDATETAAVTALNKETADSMSESEKPEVNNLLDSTSAAAIETLADGFDVSAASQLSDGVNTDDITELRKQLNRCGSKFRGVRKKESNNRKALHHAIAQAYAAAVGAFQRPEVLVAIAKKKKVPTTKASWKNPSLIVVKLMDSKLDDKTASLYGKAINCLAANKVPPEKAEAVVARHGVVALAKEEAQRQKLRKGGGAEKPPPEDSVTALRREASAVPLPANFEIEGMPEKDDEAALMIFGRQGGKLVAWAVDADEKAASAAARRALKHIRVAGTANKEDPEAA